MVPEERRNSEGRRQGDRRKRAAELLGSGLITELANDVRALIDAIDELRDEVRRRAARQHARRVRAIVGLLIALVVATQLSALRIDWCILDVHYDERPTVACDVVFPVVTHGDLRDLPPWPTVPNIVGLGLYALAAVAGWSAMRRANGLSSGHPEPDEERP